MAGAVQSELEGILARGLFEQVPFNVAVIDRDFNIVAANRNFREFFGNWEGRRCYEVYKGLSSPCEGCRAIAVFQDGLVRVADETGLDRHGRSCHYVVHLAPLRDERGEIRFVLEMTTDLTETLHWQRQYNLFFERVPCYVTIIDRHFRIVRANEKFRETFGEPAGRHCYQVYKRRDSPCPRCPARMTFEDGQEHTAEQTGVTKEGKTAHYIVTTTPVGRGKLAVEHVIEMATDITAVRELQARLREAHDFYLSLIENAATAIIAFDAQGRTRIFNPAARRLFAWDASRLPSAHLVSQWLPPELLHHEWEDDKPLELEEAIIRTAQNQQVPVRLSAMRLASGKKILGWAVLLQDLRELKRLEKEKLEAERLAAVGQTVAGLAHTIKNVLMGLEGGMYMMETGLHRGSVDRLARGFEILHRNFDKMTALIREFLEFAKGRLPNLQLANPNEIAAGVVELYREAARQHGVELVFEPGQVNPLPLDRQGIETCLTNLVSNGIDAVMMRDQPGGRVFVRTRQEGDEVIFEVADEGCGMDGEVKSKIFTTFFTTKGSKGTGLGLLTTRKVVQEHGGTIEVESSPGQGSTFRIRLSERRLRALSEAAEAARRARTGDEQP